MQNRGRWDPQSVYELLEEAQNAGNDIIDSSEEVLLDSLLFFSPSENAYIAAIVTYVNPNQSDFTVWSADPDEEAEIFQLWEEKTGK